MWIIAISLIVVLLIAFAFAIVQAAKDTFEE